MFHHEKLDVCRAAAELAAWAGELLDGPLSKCRTSSRESGTSSGSSRS